MYQQWCEKHWLRQGVYGQSITPWLRCENGKTVGSAMCRWLTDCHWLKLCYKKTDVFIKRLKNKLLLLLVVARKTAGECGCDAAAWMSAFEQVHCLSEREMCMHNRVDYAQAPLFSISNGKNTRKNPRVIHVVVTNNGYLLLSCFMKWK